MDFNKVISLQIPEGEIVSITDKEDNKLWSIDKYAYGIRWNSVNSATTSCTRIGSLELHRTLPIQSKFAVCIHQGTNIKYWCHPNDSRFRKNTTGYLFNNIKLLIEVPEGENAKAATADYSPNATYQYTMSVLDNDNSEIKLLLTTYKYLYGFIKIDDKICRVNKINTDEVVLYLSTDETINIESSTHKLELGCSINGYDGEISVYTPPFYLWSHDHNGNDNEVYISEYKCISYAEKVYPHLIAIARTPVLRSVLNNSKWGYLNTQKANTALSVINYRPELRGGNNNPAYDKYLGSDNFRSLLCKGASQMPLATMRDCCQANGGQILYYQIWKAVVWCYIIEYANFDIKKAYNPNLTSEGFHQGGLGNNILSVNYYSEYNLRNPVATNDFTLSLGNNTGIVNKPAFNFPYTTGNPSTWNSYSLSNNNVYTKSNNNTVITFTKIANTTMSNTDCSHVSGTQKYKIEGITGTDQNVIFRGRTGKQDLTITSDGTYEIEWGDNTSSRQILFSIKQDSCNISFTIVSSSSSIINMPQISLNVAHYRGFNVFWYGDSWLNIDNFLSKYDSSKDSRIFYFTDDFNKFNNNIDDKERTIESKVLSNNCLKEITVNKQGDIIPLSLISNTNYKNSYYWNDKDSSVHATFVSGSAAHGSLCGLLSLSCRDGSGLAYSNCAFAKCFILKN